MTEILCLPEEGVLMLMLLHFLARLMFRLLGSMASAPHPLANGLLPAQTQTLRLRTLAHLAVLVLMHQVQVLLQVHVVAALSAAAALARAVAGWTVGLQLLGWRAAP